MVGVLLLGPGSHFDPLALSIESPVLRPKQALHHSPHGVRSRRCRIGAVGCKPQMTALQVVRNRTLSWRHRMLCWCRSPNKLSPLGDTLRLGELALAGDLEAQHAPTCSDGPVRADCSSLSRLGAELSDSPHRQRQPSVVRDGKVPPHSGHAPHPGRWCRNVPQRVSRRPRRRGRSLQ